MRPGRFDPKPKSGLSQITQKNEAEKILPGIWGGDGSFFRQGGGVNARSSSQEKEGIVDTFPKEVKIVFGRRYLLAKIGKTIVFQKFS